MRRRTMNLRQRWKILVFRWRWRLADALDRAAARVAPQMCIPLGQFDAARFTTSLKGRNEAEQIEIDRVETQAMSRGYDEAQRGNE